MPMTSFAVEILRGFRNLSRTRAFTIPALADLAIGIAATTAVFSALSAMLLRSMGFDDPPRLVADRRAAWPTARRGSLGQLARMAEIRRHFRRCRARLFRQPGFPAVRRRSPRACRWHHGLR